MDYWKWAKAQVEYEKIVYLYDSDEIILGSGDFHKIYDEEPNLKIEFVVYEQLQFEFKKLSIEQNSNTYKIFGNRGSNMHVKFIKFQANPMKKTKKIAEDSVMIQSKQSIDDSSPFIDNSVQLLSEASEDQVVEPENNLFGDQSSIVVSRATPKSRASPKITKNLNELQNEEEIINNLDKLAKEFVDTTLAHTQDTEDILESKFWMLSLTFLILKQILKLLIFIGLANICEREELMIENLQTIDENIIGVNDFELELDQLSVTQKDVLSELQLDIDDFM